MARLEEGDIRVRETELLEADFVSLEELQRLAADSTVNMESWSQLIVEEIDQVLEGF